MLGSGKVLPSLCITLAEQVSALVFCGTNHLLTVYYFKLKIGGACRVHVIRELRSKFSTPEEAEIFYEPELADRLGKSHQPDDHHVTLV